MKQIESFLGVPVDVITEAEVIQKAKLALQKKEQLRITSVNPQISLECQNHPKAKKYIEEAQIRIPDGIGIVKASRILGGKIIERVTGYDVMIKLLSLANEEKKKIFLYGAKPDVVLAAKKEIEREYPFLSVVGAVDGYGSLSEEELVQKIQETQPDFLFVALGFPKQEEWIERNCAQLGSMIIEDVGGSFDVISGFVSRAPEWIQKIHCEWLYRSLTQKGKWMRIVQVPIFLGKIYRQKLKRKDEVN